MKQTDFGDVLHEWLDMQKEAIHTMLPAVVESYDRPTRKAKVLPAIKLLCGTGANVPYKPIEGVQVQFPSGANWGIDCELAEGDTGMLVFSEASTGNWLDGDGSGQSDAEDATRFSMHDCFFVPGIFPWGKIPSGSPATGLYLRYKDCSIHFKPDGGLKIIGDVEIQGALSTSDDVTVTGNVKASAEVSAMNASPATAVHLSTHIHPTAVGPTSPPTPGT